MRAAIPKCILPPQDKAVWAPPLDQEDLAVRLEADGITNSVAFHQYGYEDVWNMAEGYLQMAKEQRELAPPDRESSRVWRDYAKGMVFATPTLFCCLAILLFRISLWGGALPSEQAVAIAVAAIGGFIVTGGFIQIIGRQGHFYKHSKEWGLCSRSCWSAIRVGSASLLAAATFGFFLNVVFDWMPLPLFGWCAAFGICIGCYLLASGVLYVIDAEPFIVANTLLGTGVVGLLQYTTRMPLLVCQILGIIAATLACLVTIKLRFRRLAVTPIKPAPLPSLSRLVYSLWPYFAYGALYYAFLFADRIVAWSAHTESASLPLQFRGQYETALDVALLAFVVQVGWIHAGLVRFYRVANEELRRSPVNGRTRLSKSMGLFYGGQLLVFLLLLAVSSTALTAAIHNIHALRAILSVRVALLAMAGIPFLVVGLWNAALLFALSRPSLVVIATAWAFVVNISTGYVLSRVGSYDLAILGFDTGAFALACVSAYSCWQTLKTFDYHLFAATI